MTGDFELAAGELIRRLQQLDPQTLLGLFPQVGGGVRLMTLRPDEYGETEGVAVVWSDID